MERSSSQLKVFAYSGRENGLMIVGSSEALGELAEKLHAAAVTEIQEPKEDWPRQIAQYDPNIGPYKDQNDWRLSFHVEGNIPAEKIMPLQRSAKLTPLLAIQYRCPHRHWCICFSSRAIQCVLILRSP